MGFKYLTILLLLLSFLLETQEASAQCTNDVTLGKKELDSKGEGHLKVRVNANGAFEGRLIELEGGSERIAEKFSGNGNDTINFKHLSSDPEHSYKVEVDFLSEDKFLCKKRVLIDIQFSDNWVSIYVKAPYFLLLVVSGIFR